MYNRDDNDDDDDDDDNDHNVDDHNVDADDDADDGEETKTVTITTSEADDRETVETFCCFSGRGATSPLVSILDSIFFILFKVYYYESID